VVRLIANAKNKPDEHPIHSTHSYCEECHRESRQAKFEEMERAVWAGEPLVIFDDDQYFFDIESLAEYCWENSMLPSELQLLICEPNYPPEFDIEQHCEEIIPEGGDYNDLPQAILDAAEALNKAMKARLCRGVAVTAWPSSQMTSSPMSRKLKS
jgi:hypothetical protein